MKALDIPTKLLWVDLEFTGLDPKDQHITEVAAIVTDFELNEVARWGTLVNQPESVLENADEWVQENMKDLFAEVREATTTESEADEQLANFIKEHFGDEPAVLAGNSIHQDRRMIRSWWPHTEAALHYRMLDVSSLKLWIAGTTGEKMEKKEAHRAFDDIEESIKELTWCLDQLASRE